jgi:hypothetical protein
VIRITEPFHGAVLNHRLGRKVEGGLQVAVQGQAPVGEYVTVNGAAARRAGCAFMSEVTLTQHETEIVAVARGVTGQSEHRVRVVCDCNSRPRYRFSIDDNCFFLRDIAQKKAPSLFDGFYLKSLRDLHRKYGTKFVLNLFYTTPEKDFTLSQFPAAYKGEWADNADWLKLSFHAYCEFPDRPYQNATREKLAADFDQVAAEVLRFAGDGSWSPPTVIHWGMVHPTLLPVLVERGVKVLSGFFVPDQGGSYTADDEVVADTGAGYDVNYSLDNVRSEYLTRHDALKDFGSGLVFSRADIVCNNVPVDKVVSTLAPLARNPDTAEIMDLFTHEQYFWPFYANHRPDHAQRCETAIRFCAENGYAPVFFHEGFLGETA